mgnify:CR=1 FL=1
MNIYKTIKDEVLKCLNLSLEDGKSLTVETPKFQGQGDVSLNIAMVLPFPVTKPVGGAKIIYEYANRLFERGHSITIYHSIKRPFKNAYFAIC